MPDHRLRLGPDTLWGAVVAATRRAVRLGVVHPIDTTVRTIEDSGVRFAVRIVSSLARKDEDRARQAVRSQQTGTPVDPFLPYDEALCAGELSDTHVCLLNKFNVINHHLLLVTRAFEHQEALLTRADFDALCTCLQAFDGLAFYNGGEIAGASQPHKHLQVVPLPLATAGPPIPIAPLLASARPISGIGMVAGFPFLHVIARLDPSIWRHRAAAVAAVRERYAAMLAATGIVAIDAKDAGGERRQSAPYNLLLTRRWMLLVPRSREHFEGISVNALGFAGSLLVRNAEQMRSIEACGPMTILRRVAVAIP